MVRDGVTGDWIGTWDGHKGAVWSCRLDALGNLAVTASGDYSVALWDAITGKLICTLPHKHICKCGDFSPNSRFLATAGHEGILRIFDLEKVLIQKQYTPLLEIPHEGYPAISKLNWWNNDIVLTGAKDGKIRFWDVNAAINNKGAILTPIAVIDTDEGAEIRDMEISASGQILSVAAGKKVYFFDMVTKNRMKSYDMPIHFRDEGGCSLHPDGSKFIAGGSDLWVRVFDVATGQELACLKGHVSILL
jgi:serine-threonine kinase receptor-associated protein